LLATELQVEGSERVTMDWVQLASLGSNIQRRNQVVNIPSHSTGPGFNSRPGDRQFWLRFFVVSPSRSRLVMGQNLKLSHDRFLPHPFQLTIHGSLFYLTLWVQSYSKSGVKWIHFTSLHLVLLILGLGTRWGWVVSVTPRPRFTPGERTPGTHCTGDCVGPRAGLDTEVRGKILSPLPGIDPRSPGRPARSQTLYWLSYPGYQNETYRFHNTRLD
jgi:hypothetical protein